MIVERGLTGAGSYWEATTNPLLSSSLSSPLSPATFTSFSFNTPSSRPLQSHPSRSSAGQLAPTLPNWRAYESDNHPSWSRAWTNLVVRHQRKLPSALFWCLRGGSLQLLLFSPACLSSIWSDRPVLVTCRWLLITLCTAGTYLIDLFIDRTCCEEPVDVYRSFLAVPGYQPWPSRSWIRTYEFEPLLVNRSKGSCSSAKTLPRSRWRTNHCRKGSSGRHWDISFSCDTKATRHTQSS